MAAIGVRLVAQLSGRGAGGVREERLDGGQVYSYVDHRGHGRSDKPPDPAAYAMPLRVAYPTRPVLNRVMPVDDTARPSPLRIALTYGESSLTVG